MLADEEMTMAMWLLLLVAVTYKKWEEKLTVLRYGPELDDCRGFTPVRDMRER